MLIKYSDAPAKLLKEVDNFSGSLLKKRHDLQIIFEETLTHGRDNLLEEIIFNAKYVNGLMKVLKEASTNSEVKNLDNIQNDLSENITKLINSLRDALTSADGSVTHHFERNFFQMSQQSFTNLVDLIHDLDWTKKYLNDQKRHQN